MSSLLVLSSENVKIGILFHLRIRHIWENFTKFAALNKWTFKIIEQWYNFTIATIVYISSMLIKRAKWI